jgi:hypothetical protein
VHLKVGASFTVEHTEIAKAPLVWPVFAGFALSAVSFCKFCPILKMHPFEIYRFTEGYFNAIISYRENMMSQERKELLAFINMKRHLHETIK